jgi:hypothetical protein
MEPVFAQMDPMKIGEDYRSTTVAEEYALRLNTRAQNLIIVSEHEGAIDTLVRGYPSHGFVIDRTEAKTLFRRVSEITPPLLSLVQALGPDAVFARSSLRSQAPILEYLNSEEAGHDQPTVKAPAKGDKPSGGKRAASEGPRPNEPVPPAPSEGDGKLAV